MFETKAEAEEINSECAFCGCDKFVVIRRAQGWDLERCTTEECAVHCHGGHKQVITQSYLNNADAVAIASGW